MPKLALKSTCLIAIVAFSQAILLGLNQDGKASLLDTMQSGLIRAALTSNVAPRDDWSNGTLHNLRILQKILPIRITVTEDFENLNDFQILFLNLLNISDSDIATIANWVDAGGVAVCIGQSGRYDETGKERTAHPLSHVLGITLNGWERDSGANVRKILVTTSWHWWSSGRIYDVTNNGDGLYHESADIYYVPKDECVNVTLNGAAQIMSAQDKNLSSYFPPFPTFTTYEEPLLTTHSYGSGRAFFVAADIFYRLLWKPPRPQFGIYTNENSLVGGYWFRIGLLWQILYAITLDSFSTIPLPIVTSMPNGFHTAMSFGIKTVGYGVADNDTADDSIYENMMKYWKPQLLDQQPTLKGWFWGFWIMTKTIDKTTNASNIVSFVTENGYAGSRSHTGHWALSDYIKSSEILHSYGFDYDYEGSAGATVKIQDLATLTKNWNFTDIFYLRRISGKGEHGAEISCLPYPISNHTGIVNFFAQPYAVELAGSLIEWRLLISRQKVLGENYGIGGYCMGDTYLGWIGSIENINETINTFIADDTVWKTNGPTFEDWWNKRWDVTITDFSTNSTHVEVTIQTPKIENLTLLMKEAENIYNITVDGAPLTPLPESSRIVIPKMAQGVHKISIKISLFGDSELDAYNKDLETAGRPYIYDSTHLIESLNFTYPRLTLTLFPLQSESAKIKIHSLYSPLKAFADGSIIEFNYGSNITTISTSQERVDLYYAQPQIIQFLSTKQEYEINETATFVIEIYGDHPTSEVAKWIVRLSLIDEGGVVVSLTAREIEISMDAAKILQIRVSNLLLGHYSAIAEVLDPQTADVLAVDSLNVTVKEGSEAPPLFSASTLENYNDQLKQGGLPYVESSTQTVVGLVYSTNYQRLSINLDANLNSEATVEVSSLHSPVQVFANNHPLDFAYYSNTCTILTSHTQLDLYFVQLRILEFKPTKKSYNPNEPVEVTLKIDEDRPSGTGEWFAWIELADDTAKTIATIYKEIVLNETTSAQVQLTLGNFSEGTYSLTIQLFDPESENMLETASSTIEVTALATEPLFPPLLLAIVVLLLGTGIAIYIIHRVRYRVRNITPEKRFIKYYDI
ncbi:MAG: hypothetical protein JSW72_03975 [Candidatus Bathyarchaeota archaeon]|nr:MAG: hypothetical protein JSW72_03975 [Candidatus Bathyarchaeota archaeon]